jgi:hypothetical protein
MEERMLKLFAYGHVEREDLQAVFDVPVTRPLD